MILLLKIQLTTGRDPLPDGRGEKTKILVTPLGAGMIIGKGGADIKQMCVSWPDINICNHPAFRIFLFYEVSENPKP